MTLLDAFYLPAAVLTAPWWARKVRSGWGERLGKIEALPAKRSDVPRVLLHAVSVGEVNTLRGLVPMLREGGCEVVVSAMTDTGLKRARELFAGMEGVFVVRFCLDFSPAVRRFLDAVRPDVVALVELEVWPNFVRACVGGGRKIPVGVINGRLSARSFRGYHRFKRFIGPTFARLAFVGAQDAAYAERFAVMGVAPARLSITGSMKWDAIPGSDADVRAKADQLARDLGIDRGKPLIVAGSTAPIEGIAGGGGEAGFDCEEALLHAACPEGVQLLCALRKPEHYAKAFAALGGAGMCARRSSPTPHSPSRPISRFLLDTIGELRAAYTLADVAVVGRTWGAGRGGGGGSDPIEPIALGRATILGPRYSNFESIVQTFAGSGAVVIAQAADVAREVRALLADPARREALARRGAACIAAQQGATMRHADLIFQAIRAR